MAITCLCPQCQKTLAISEEYAGQPMRCPLCMAMFQSPAVPAAAGRVAASAAAPTTPWSAPSAPTQPATPAAAPELQELRNGTSSRLPTGWHMVRRGLGIIPTGVLVAIFVVLGCRAFLAMADPGKTTYEVVMLITVPVTALAILSTVVGGALCGLVPRESGLRNVALAAAATLLASLIVGLVTLLIRVFGMKQAGKPSALDWGPYVPAFLLAFAGGIVFLWFLRGVARFFKNQRLVQGVLWCIIGVGVSPLLFLMLYLMLWATSAAVGGDGSGLARLSGIVLYGVIAADLFWFLRVLSEVRRTVEKGYLGAAA